MPITTYFCSKTLQSLWSKGNTSSADASWRGPIYATFRIGGIIFTYLLSAIPLAFPLPAQELSSKVDEYMQTQVAEYNFSGSILIAQGGEVVVSKGYGLAGARRGVPNTSKTRYRLGSIAGLFTDIAILQLQEKGELRLQDSVCKYIAECPDGWQEVRIFNLLTHTSGISDISSSSAYENSTLGAPTVSELVARIKREPLRFKPGEKLEYSYSESEVLNAVIERISGHPYSRYLKAHIFTVLGMHNTGYDTSLRIQYPPGAKEGRLVSLLEPSDLQLSLPYTVGRLYSTVEDLYLWDLALSSEKLLSQESLKQMFKPYRDGYGYGWMVRKELDRKLITQGGGIRMYSTSIRRYPDDVACVVVLSDMETADTGKVSHDLAAILFGKYYELAREHKVVRLDPATYNNYVGQYALAPNFVLTVTREGDRLMIQGTGQAKIEILPESESRFFINGSDAKINFIKIPNGSVTQLVLQQGGSDVSAGRLR
jgi:CubicO group peptidase (beta-lactamase class C family)